MRKINLFLFLILFLGTIAACKKNDTHNDDSSNEDKEVPKEHAYTNPVFEPILADPSVIKADDGWFYAYGTQDNWGDGDGTHLIPIICSQDLVHWAYVGDAFNVKPGWKPEGGYIWAPDVEYINDRYYMYYAYSLWGDPDPGVGLAISSSPRGPFYDHGKLFLSSEVGVANFIDPFYIEDNGKKYLACGSFSRAQNQGIYLIELTDNGMAAKDLSKKTKLAAGDFEGTAIYKHDGYYYFFGSKGSCCNGANSTYQVRVARSTSLFGPYLDKEGNDIRQRGNGILLIKGNDVYAGPGHNANIITDEAGNEWFIYHAIKKSNPTVSSGANRRVLMIDQLRWTDDGWPFIKGNSPSTDRVVSGSVF